MGFAFRFLLGPDVQGDLFTFGPGWMHLRQESADVTSDFGTSFAFEHIVNDIPALLHFATGCDEGGLSRLRLIAVATNIRIELRVDIGGRVALVRAKNAICLWNSRLAAHRALGGIRRDALFA
jgi:hypothetical protein